MWVDRSVKGEPKERMLREKNKVGRTGITRKKLEKAGFESVGPVMAWGPMVRSGGGGREVGKDAGPGGWVVMGEAGGGKRGGITHRHRRKGLEALDPDKKDAGRATTVDGSGRPRAPGVGGAGRGRCGGRSPIGRGQEGAGSTPGRRAGCAAPLLREQLGPRSGAGYRVRSPGGSQGWGRAGAGFNDMGSADSKLNFRKAVIQLTTKTQVRTGPRPPHPLAGLGAGQGWGASRTWLARRWGDQLARRVTPRPGLERDSLACTLGLHPLSPHPQPLLPGTSSPSQLLLPP